MKKVIIGIIAIAVVAGGAAWLWKANSKTDSSTTPSSTATTSPSPASSTGNAVEISGFAFSPASLSVKKGTTVTWTNKDSAAHTVTESDGKNGPHSTNLDSGKSYSFTFTQAGTYHYHCVIHPDMTGTIVVQ